MTLPPIRLSLYRFVNVYLVPEKDGLTLIDTALPPIVPQVERAVQQLGLPLRRILLTHGHSDHAGGLDSLKAAFPGAEVMMHRADEHHLAKNGVQTRPDRWLEGHERIGCLQVIPAPGHSAGQLAFFDDRDGTLYAGDSFTAVGTLRAVSEFRLDLTALAWRATEDRALALETATELCEVPGLRWLAPGHGKVQADAAALMREAVARVRHTQHQSPPEWQLTAVRKLGQVVSGRRGE